MSRHSKNNTSSSVFTYAEKQKLKGVYGTKNERISQDSIKKFQMCTLCSNKLIEPTCCDKGHMFCRSCIIQYLVKQKKKIMEHNEECEQEKKKQIMKEQQKKLEEEVIKIDKFEKYDNFLDLSDREKLFSQDKNKNQHQKKQVDASEAKPTGMYEINADKDKYLKTSFWTIQNTPKFDEKKDKKQNIVKCPGSDHKITRKKLKDVKCKDIEGQFCCLICNKEIGRQRIGIYRCGHLICKQCKSDKCEICGEEGGWIDVEGSASSYALHDQASIKTYTYAFYA